MGLWSGVWVRVKLSHWGGCMVVESKGMNEGNIGVCAAQERERARDQTLGEG